MTDRIVQDHGLAVAAKAPLLLVLLLGSLTALGPLSIDMYLPGLPAIATSLHASASASELTVSTFFIGLTLGQLVYGPLSDRVGRRGPLLVGLALYALGSAACALASSIEVLLVARVVQALGSSCGAVIARAVVRDRFPPNQMLHVFSLLMLVLGVSPIFAPLVGSWILLVGNWRSMFWAMTGFAIVLLAAVALGLKESRTEETAAHARTENPLRSYVALLKNRLILGYLLTMGFAGSGLFTYIAASPDVLIRHYNVSPQAYGYVFGINGAGLIAMTQINARLARRWRSDEILRWSLIAAVVVGLAQLGLAATGWGGLAALLAPMFLLVSAQGINQPNASNGAMIVDARRAGATSSLTGAFSFGVGSLFSGLVGLLNDGTARPMAMVMAAAYALALVSFLALVRRERLRAVAG